MVMAATASAVAALALCYLLARERFGTATAVIAVLGVAAGSPVLWHPFGAPAIGASASLSAGALGAYAWVRASRGARPGVTWRWAAAGVAAGVVAMLPATGVLAGGGGLPVGDVLWSSRGGWLSTSPAVWLGVIGLVALWRTGRAIAFVGAILMAVTAIAVASRPAWREPAWPSPPAFLALTPYVVCGVAALIDVIARLAARRPVPVVASMLGVLVIWNVTLMKAATDAAFHLGEPVSFGHLGYAQAKALHGWIGHPLSMPANLVHAASNGVAPGAYDLLAPARLLRGDADTGEIDIGEGDGAFVGAGWHGAERDGGRSFRWATRSALVDLPLDHAADLVVEVTVRPYQPPKAPPQRITLAVNGASFGPVTLASGWHPAVVAVPRAAWRSGVNHLELRFAYDAQPSAAGIPDGRALSASVDAIAVRVAP
jgi:hypothetical protein